MNEKIADRLQRLRADMEAHGIDLTVIAHSDPHQSEYMADHWHVREFFSGFNGSAGTLVVSLNHGAALWTDSRYFLQAAQQLEGTGIDLMKDGLPDTPAINDYVTELLPAGARVGIDGWTFSVNAVRDLAATLDSRGISLDTAYAPAERLWADRPAMPDAKAFIHEEKYAGEPTASKIAAVLKDISVSGANGILISALDAIAWTLNLRGRDVTCNPVVTALLYLSPEESALMIDPAKLTPEVAAHLAANGVTTVPYSTARAYLAALPDDSRVMIDPAQTAYALAQALGDRAMEGTSPVSMLKSVKNAVQLEGIRHAMERDGVAMVKAVMEIQRRVNSGEPLTEMGVDRLLTHFRSQSPMYFDNSFGTIAGYKDHGAIVHYEATPESDATLHPDGLLLIDSGAQYLDGTTDITRTISLGNPTADERHDFTLVMKGHIALAAVTFPEGTRGDQLDVLARMYLWAEGKTYLHGTGHGVGHFLNVHEGPQSIRMNHVDIPLRPGMITSNEPGLYLTGRYGIRCENLVVTEEACTTDAGRFLRFRTVTLFPFDRTLFDTSIMTEAEIRWVDDYHATVRRTLSPLLDTEAERAWLDEATRPLDR